jgi:DNA repair exonuclease SbcCD nuclease subunit
MVGSEYILSAGKEVVPMGDETLKNDLEPVANAEQKNHDGVITVVLTADNHLGYTGFGQHPHKREERQQRLRHAFQQAADFAIAQGVDLFIQAGDLFDTTTPAERDRSFVASCLARLKQAGIQTFALGGVHDTPITSQTLSGNDTPAPQMSYARLGALHYFPPLPQNEKQQLEPVIVDVHGTKVGLCGLGILAGQVGDPLQDLDIRVSLEIERAAIPILVLHAPIEGLTVGSSLLDTRALATRESICKQPFFRFLFAGYHHNHHYFHVGKTDVVVAGATQYVDFSTPDQAPGFVFLGLDANGVRWCNHISVDALSMHRLVIHTSSLWPASSPTPSPSSSREEQTDEKLKQSQKAQTTLDPTEAILERLRPLCNDDAMIQLCLEGELTRSAYHQLDLNLIRRYGEEHCFALAMDDSALFLLPEEQQETLSPELDERFSLREELATLADELIAESRDEHEKQVLQFTKEELLLAIDEAKNK